MTIDEKRELISESIRQLAGDPRFKEFIGAVHEMREQAIREACMADTVGNEGMTRAALGHIRAYEDILTLVAEYSDQLSAES